VRALLAAAVLLAACAAEARNERHPLIRPVITAETIFVSCMAAPPPVVVIDWPDADSIGNVLMHTSTVDRVKGAYADLRRYVDEQYFSCLHVAERAGEQTVTVEVDP
jgi:hypothetical protein